MQQGKTAAQSARRSEVGRRSSETLARSLRRPCIWHTGSFVSSLLISTIDRNESYWHREKQSSVSVVLLSPGVQ